MGRKALVVMAVMVLVFGMVFVPFPAIAGEAALLYPGIGVKTAELFRAERVLANVALDKYVLEMTYIEGDWTWETMKDHRYVYYISAGGWTFLLQPEQMEKNEKIRTALGRHRSPLRHLKGYLVTAEQLRKIVQRENQKPAYEVRMVRAGGRIWYAYRFLGQAERQYFLTDDEYKKYGED